MPVDGVWSRSVQTCRLEDTLAQARGEIGLGLTQVYRALGGGWQIRLADCETTAPLPPVVPAPPTDTRPGSSPEAIPAPPTPATKDEKAPVSERQRP